MPRGAVNRQNALQFPGQRYTPVLMHTLTKIKIINFTKTSLSGIANSIKFM